MAIENTMEKETTTIQIYKATKNKLSDIGKRKETYDDIINHKPIGSGK